MLENDLKGSTERNHAISPRNQVLLALRFFASGSMYEVIGKTGQSRTNKRTNERTNEQTNN
jgi:hypothetical protein